MSNEKFLKQNSPRSLVKSMSVISLGTLASRILGFVRDIILAKFLGTGFQADALFVAFRIPNLFRDFVGEGATNSAVVPVFSEHLVKEERTRFWRFVSGVLVLAVAVLAVLSVLGVLLAPIIVRLIAPGFMEYPEKLSLTVSLTRIMFPYLFFIGLTAYSMAILYTFRKFTAPAFSPCLLNIAIIVSAAYSFWYMKNPVYGIAVGILVGGFLQMAVQIPPLYRIGFRFQTPILWHHPGIRQIWTLLIPRMVGAGVYQLTIFVDTFCASLASIVGAGGISAIYYSNRIIQLPMGVFSIALASAVLPTLSSLAAEKNTDRLRETIIFALENMFFIMVPISVLTMLMSRPIIHALFERGEFDAYSTSITSSALLFYAIGLFAFGSIKILVSCFHALQDTRTPVKVSAACLAINATLNFILMIPMKVAGIAFASSIAALINFSVLLLILEGRVSGIIAGLWGFSIRVFFSSLVAAAALQWLWPVLSQWHEIAALALGSVLAVCVYFAVALGLKIPQACKIWEWMSGKKS